jgi:hypothetical protein
MKISSEPKSHRHLGAALAVLSASVLVAGFNTPALAQQANPTVTGFVQAGWSGQLSENPYGLLPESSLAPEVGHTFRLVQGRLYFRGTVDDRVGYAIQGNFAGGFSLLTAYMTYKLNDDLTLMGGQMLKPFGRDRTRARHLLQSFNRTVSSSQIVNALRYGHWDVGAMARLTLSEGGTLSAGVFNGRGSGPTADNDTGKNMVGRFVLPLGSLNVGVSASMLHLNTLPSDDRNQFAWGLDGALGSDSFSLEGELLSAADWANYNVGTGESPTQTGIALTGKLAIAPMLGSRSTELVVRLERFDPDGDADDDEWLLIVPNLNLVVSDAARFQIGVIYESPADSALDPGITGVVLWQVNFF